MRVRNCVLVAAAVLLLAGGTALAGVITDDYPLDVYVSNPKLGQIWRVSWDPVGDSWGTPTLVFAASKVAVEDMVVGPDDLLYACAPDDGLVIRFDPWDPDADYPLDDKDVDKVYDGSLALQCGWFSDLGDLFTTGEDGVYAFYNLVPLDATVEPPTLPTTPALLVDDAGLGGEGITQAAPGDLLYVSQGDHTIYSLPFDPVFRFNKPSDPNTVKDPRDLNVTSLSTPVGIARSGAGIVYLTDGPFLFEVEYDDTVDPVTSSKTDCETFSGFTAEHLAFSAEDRLFVATTSADEARLVEVNTEACGGGGDTILTFAKQPDADGEIRVNKPAMSGVAVSRSSRAGSDLGPAVGESFSYDETFGFEDHVYRLDYVPDEACSASVVAVESQPSCLAELIGRIGDDPDDPGAEVSASGVPVTYAGDGGVAQLYQVTGTCNSEESIAHAIAAYTRLTQNPRLVRCGWIQSVDSPVYPIPSDPPSLCDGGTAVIPTDPNHEYDFICEIITLDYFFPFDGLLPDDADLRGSRQASASGFSHYFFGDIRLAGDSTANNNTPGCFCGWESPLPNVEYLNPDNPYEAVVDFGPPMETEPLPIYNINSSVPLKFRVAARVDPAVWQDYVVNGGEEPALLSCEFDDPCGDPQWGYVTNAKVLLAIARVFNTAGDSDYEPYRPDRAGSSDDSPYFGNPTSPSTPYHYNVDSSGFTAGVFQAVAIAITDNFAVEWTYFAMSD